MDNKKLWELPRSKAERWVKALRSGKYKQANGRLYDIEHEGYCCLGVYAQKEKPDIDNRELSEFGNLCSPCNTGEMSFYIEDLPSALEYKKPESETVCLSDILIGMNDDTMSLNELSAEMKSLPVLKEYIAGIRKGDFNDIADFIEANVKFVDDDNNNN